MIVRTLNRLTDMDWGWWPFLFLRPKQTERMTTRRVALMSLLYGLCTGGSPLLRSYLA